MWSIAATISTVYELTKCIHSVLSVSYEYEQQLGCTCTECAVCYEYSIIMYL